MKIVGKGHGKFQLIPESQETLRDIAIALIIASYELAQPFGLGQLRAYGTQLTKEMASRMLDGEDISKDYAMNRNKRNEVDMDYVFGRCCKTMIKVIPLTNEVIVFISERDRNPQKILERTKEILKRRS